MDSEGIFGEGLGLDSIDALEFVVLIEEEFEVAIPDEDVTGFRQKFEPVAAQGRTDTLYLDGQPAAPLTCWTLGDGETLAQRARVTPAQLVDIART